MIEEIQIPLQKICGSVDGALAATVMGFDGLPVDAYTHHEPGGELDISSLIIEFSSLLGQVKASAQMFAAGGWRSSRSDPSGSPPSSGPWVRSTSSPSPSSRPGTPARGATSSASTPPS